MYNRTTNSLEFSESTFVYFPKPISTLDWSKLKINVTKQSDFEVLLSYSYDNKHYSAFKTQQSGVLGGDIWVCIWFRKVIHTDLEPVITMFEINDSTQYWGNKTKMQNVTSSEKHCIVSSISYDGNEVCLNDLQLKVKFDLIDEFPRWNMYDMQEINIQRWLETCNAMAEMYGHTAIYFKTEPIEFEEADPQTGIHGTHFTLANNVVRNVVDVKKLHIMFPNNELPQDRVVFSEWDIGMQDETMIHVVRQKFEQAFGLKAIPNEKDFIYLPIVNKLFRVSTSQTKVGFMGTVGWYEVFLSKYEEDATVRKESVLMNNELSNSMSDVFGFEPEKFGFESYSYDEVMTDTANEQFEELKEDGLNHSFNDLTNRIEEEKTATNNLSNRLVDTTFYISMKETEALRNFFDQRLKIVSINPGTALHPITMYDASSVTKNQIALNYQLQSYNIINKFELIARKQMTFCFDFVVMSRFNGVLFELGSDNYVATQISLRNKKLIVRDTATQVEMMFEHALEQKELYQIVIELITVDKPLYSIKLFKLSSNRSDKTTQKQLLNQDIYNLKELAHLGIVRDKNFQQKIDIINLFGGSFLVGNISLKLDNNRILEDKCLPLINKNLK